MSNQERRIRKARKLKANANFIHLYYDTMDECEERTQQLIKAAKLEMLAEILLHPEKYL